MYFSDRGLQLIQEERVNSWLAQAEQRRMFREARDVASGGKRSRRSWKALFQAALRVLPSGSGKPSYEPSSGAEQ